MVVTLEVVALAATVSAETAAKPASCLGCLKVYKGLEKVDVAISKGDTVEGIK